MLRFTSCCFRHFRLYRICPKVHFRNFSDDPKIIMGGGLEKPQGGLKEERYFCTQNYDLLSKMREQGSKLKCENCIGDWNEFEKVLSVSEEPTALRETCSLNKHKNCLEEAFFLNEQNDCCTKLVKENKLLNVSNLKSGTQNIEQLDTIENE